MYNLDEISKYIMGKIKSKEFDRKTAAMILARLYEQKSGGDGSIAVIGMSCRLPLADNINMYWNNLMKGVSGIREFPENRKKDIEEYAESGSFYKAGYLDSIDEFDPLFFRISPREARLMEPDQKILLEVLYEAIEDSGYAGKKIYSTSTGVYVGAEHTNKIRNSYLSMLDDVDMLTLTGSMSGILASRISYILNLRGPCMVIDTACSSGMVGVHLACQAISDGQCDMAVAGGVNLLLKPVKNKAVSDIESNDSEVRAFDEKASGTAWGEGVAAVVLKEYNAAVRDRDNIYAVIKSSAVNNDGASSRITAPEAGAQTELLKRAWKTAEINPETISYIEAHGTGTLLGDPIEIKGITDAFRAYTDRKQFCGIGSVKPI